MQRPFGRKGPLVLSVAGAEAREGGRARPAGLGVRGKGWGRVLWVPGVMGGVSAADGQYPICIFVFPDVIMHVVKKDQIILRTF